MGNAASLTMNHCYLIDEGDKKRLVKTWLKKQERLPRCSRTSFCF
jgi:hypothetical protein